MKINIDAFSQKNASGLFCAMKNSTNRFSRNLLNHSHVVWNRSVIAAEFLAADTDWTTGIAR